MKTYTNHSTNWTTLPTNTDPNTHACYPLDPRTTTPNTALLHYHSHTKQHYPREPVIFQETV